ncbi:hypothetical protein ACH5RR_022490 [Cinchona calisaya]|uniref:Uncharacterized protein n=1 Tax=Cinchona calisaya TaxID=153742 RepID=A0ABD2Z8Z1_9GENT
MIKKLKSAGQIKSEESPPDDQSDQDYYGLAPAEVTEPELVAAYQLIQLSGDSAADHSSSSSSKTVKANSFDNHLMHKYDEAAESHVIINSSIASTGRQEISSSSSSYSSVGRQNI